MTSDKKNIDILFKNGLAAFRESPPADAWKKLEHDLNKEKAVFFRYYFRWIAASILILVAFGAGYFYASFNLQDPQIVMEEKAKEQPAINNLIDYSSDDDAEKHSLNSKLSEEPDVNMTAKEVSSSVQNPIQIRSEIALNDLDDQNPINEEFGKKRNIINSEKERSSESEIVNPLASNEMLLKDQKNSDEDGNISKEFKNSEQTDNLRALVINHEDDLYLPGTEKHARSKLSVGVQFAPVYSYRDISINYENQSQNNTNEV
ncbi:MAG: hypothetical protein FJY07_03135, partial [Bacteroidetes bacterium]|nr:hypothetical protein [Bacteroidota bacterium]